MGFIIRKSIIHNMMDGNQLNYEFDNRDLDHITFKGDGKEPFSFNRVLVENLIETFETMQDIYSDNYGIKVYTGNCIIQLNVNPKNLSESFFDVYDSLGRGLANQIKINKTIPVSHKPKEERRMMFICGDDIASLIKRFENESK